MCACNLSVTYIREKLGDDGIKPIVYDCEKFKRLSEEWKLKFREMHQDPKYYEDFCRNIDLIISNCTC